MPGANQRALAKAPTIGADVFILDLEDSVAPAAKAEARDQVCALVRSGGFGQRKLVIRVNGPDTDWGEADLEAAVAARPHAVLVPKVDTGAAIAGLASRIEALGAGETRLWAMIETPLGVLNAAAIAAASDRLEAFVMGTNDLNKDLQAEFRPDRMPLAASLGLALLAARAHGRICIDGVYNAFRDEDGFRAECEAGRAMGFDGKTLIHPAQVALANEVFAPSGDAVAEAQAIADAFAEATARGQGVAVLNGKLVENLHVAAAERTLARSRAIQRMAEAMQAEAAE